MRGTTCILPDHRETANSCRAVGLGSPSGSEEFLDLAFVDEGFEDALYHELVFLSQGRNLTYQLGEFRVQVGNVQGGRQAAILELLYSSALRNSELRLLKLEDADLARLTVRIRDGKGGHSRVVPLGEHAAIWLERYLEQGGAFCCETGSTGLSSARGRPLRVEPVARLVQKHAEVAGLSMRVTPHILRHCCATHMLANEAKLRHLQELLGHASADSTRLYTRVDFSDLREAHQRCHPREGGK